MHGRQMEAGSRAARKGGGGNGTRSTGDAHVWREEREEGRANGEYDANGARLASMAPRPTAYKAATECGSAKALQAKKEGRQRR